MRNSRFVTIAPMAVFGSLGLLLLAYFFGMPDAGGPFHDNLLPELIGFCIEGFFLVGLLTMMQRSRERAHRKEMWLSVRGALRGFLSKLDIALLAPNAEPALTRALEQNPSIVRHYLRELQSTRLDMEAMVTLKRESIDILGLARDLIPVAAQLSANHMRWWIAIVNSIRQLSQAQSREAIEQGTYLLLENLQEFDRLSS